MPLGGIVSPISGAVSTPATPRLWPSWRLSPLKRLRMRRCPTSCIGCGSPAPEVTLSLRPNSFARGLFVASLLAAASAAAADILVVRSTGPSSASYPPGKRLPDNARLTLQAADQLMLLDGRGTRMVRGPGTFSAGAAPQQVA